MNRADPLPRPPRPARLHDWSAVDLAAAYRELEVSPVEVLRSVWARIDAFEPHLFATYAPDPTAALDAARASEARWLRGTALGPLDGVPVTVKENIASRGVPTPLGTAATDLTPAEHDAPPMARLREAGAVLVAKTTMPDLGMLSSGLSSFHPLTRNPWRLDRNPGGSSAGAGAAAAAGYGPLHLGTDIGGSIRLPAGWCGVVGVKPSLGRIPIHPPYAGRVAGPMTRSVADAALAMGVLSRPDARDTMSLPWQPLDWLDLQPERFDPDGPRRLHDVRIGLLMDMGWGLPVHPEVRQAVEAAARRFEAAGAIVEPVAPFMARSMVEGLDAFWRMRAWLDISAWPMERQSRVLPFIVEWAQAAARLSGEAVFRGYGQMGAMRDAAAAACAPYDAVLSPTAPIPAFAADWPCPTNDPAMPFEHIAFTLPFNMSEQPAVSIPAGSTSDGLPIGLQIIGRRHDDLGVLRLARTWETLRGPQPDWPEPPAVPRAAGAQAA
jgi:aspartyl-tRNA(Asn)/glutamyl-tRNA(Gln) amidotransferase subunit A